MKKQSQRHAEKNCYMAVGRGFLRKPSRDLHKDGCNLVSQCFEKLLDKDFPPKLLVLMATEEFQPPFSKLLKGIQDELHSRKINVPLVGCSTAAVMTERTVSIRGAILVCYASKYISVKVGVSENILKDKENAIKDLIRQIGLTDSDLNFNPKGDKFILCFLPGYNTNNGKKQNFANEIHEAIRAATHAQIPMVGGVAADKFKHESGWTFLNNVADTSTVIIVLIESYLRFGIGMDDGLIGTEEFLFIGGTAEDGHRITSFERVELNSKGRVLKEIPPKQIIDEYKNSDKIILFQSMTKKKGERVILYPFIDKKDGSIYVSRKVHEHWPVEILICEPDGFNKTAINVAFHAVRKGDLDLFHMVCALGFPCAARYEFPGKDKRFSLHKVLKEFRQIFPDVPIAAGFVYGEIGLEHFGRSVLRNFTVSGLFLSDEFSVRGIRERYYISSSQVKWGDTIKEVIDNGLNFIDYIGFADSMISLIFREQEKNIIVAQNAFNEKWKNIIKITKRIENQCDILDIVAREKVPKFIANSKHHKNCNQEAVEICGVISQYIVPLLDDVGNTIGLLQIDLGDMSNLIEVPDYISDIINRLAKQISFNLNRTYRHEELELSEIFDRAVAMALTTGDEEIASMVFINVIRDNKILQDINMHIRLLTEDCKSLKITAGYGKYFDTAKIKRKTIPVKPINLNEDSPTAKSFNLKDNKWVNDTFNDIDSKNHLRNILDDEIRNILKIQESYANIMIQPDKNVEPIGVITIMSEREYYFSENIKKSMQTLGQRLYISIENANKEKLRKEKASETELLLKTTPIVTKEVLKKSLNRNAKILAKAMKADVVSFYFWDEEISGLVLKGQHGWKNRLIDSSELSAIKSLNVASTKNEKYGYDKINKGELEYEEYMFGKCSEITQYERIQIPLKFERYIGLMVFYNAIYKENMESRFATINKRLLTLIASKIASYISAKIAEEQKDRKSREVDLANRVMKNLAHDIGNNLSYFNSKLNMIYDITEKGELKNRISHLIDKGMELVNLVDDYLNKIQSGDINICDFIHLNNVLFMAAQRCKDKAEENNVKIIIPDKPIVYIRGSSLQLEGAFWKIIDNGIKFMPEGGCISITFEVDPVNIKIIIKDEGIGMPEEIIPIALSGNYRPISGKRAKMGLYMAKYVFEQHNGNFDLRNDPIRGMVATITIPYVKIED